jgi:hypothetical protein
VSGLTEGLILPAKDLPHLAQYIQLAIAPVFLLAGLGAFLNVCAGRLARIVDRARRVEARILSTRGSEHDRLVEEVRLLDWRIRTVNAAIFSTVLAALLISAVVILMFAAFLTSVPLGIPIAILFIAAMVATGTGFAIFLHETRIASRSVRIRNAILDHQAEE